MVGVLWVINSQNGWLIGLVPKTLTIVELQQMLYLSGNKAQSGSSYSTITVFFEMGQNYTRNGDPRSSSMIYHHTTYNWIKTDIYYLTVFYATHLSDYKAAFWIQPNECLQTDLLHVFCVLVEAETEDKSNG